MSVSPKQLTTAYSMTNSICQKCPQDGCPPFCRHCKKMSVQRFLRKIWRISELKGSTSFVASSQGMRHGCIFTTQRQTSLQGMEAHIITTAQEGPCPAVFWQGACHCSISTSEAIRSSRPVFHLRWH